MSKVIHVHLIFEKKNIYFAKYTKRAMIIQSRLITCTRKG